MGVGRFAILIAIAAGCTESAYGESTASDAGQDAIEDVATGDAGVADANGPLITNGGFEDETPACGPSWDLVNASAVRSTPARSGAVACRVCNTGGSGVFGLRANREPRSGTGSWTVEAFFRSAPDAGAPTTAQVRLTWPLTDGGTATDTRTSPLTSTYAPVQVVRQLGGDSIAQGDLQVWVQASGGTSTCFLVDDVSVTRVP